MARIKRLIEKQNELLEKLGKEQNARTDGLYLRLDRIYDLLLELMKPTPAEPMPECTLFDGMNKAVADFDKACTEAGFKCTEQKKRPKGDILREATERNLISIDGLRMRYGWSKPAIIEAINFYKWPLEKIEGSNLDYVDKSHIFILKEYFTPKRIG